MLTALLAAGLVLQTGAVTPKGDVEEIAWGRGAKVPSGYAVSEQGLTVDVEGPGFVLLELRGDAAKRDLAVELLRDGKFVSANEVTLKRAKGAGPKGLGFEAKLGVKVPAGAHTYVIKAAEPLAVRFTTAKSVPPRVAVAVEAEVATPAEKTVETAVAAAPAEMTPASEIERVTALSDATEITAAPAAAGGTASDGHLATAMRVAVYDFESEGVEPKIASVVTDSVLAEIRKLQSVSVIGAAEIRDMLSHEATKQLIGCEDSESCLAEIAGALGVDNLVTGKLANAAGSNVFVMRRIDQKRASVIGTVNRRLEAASGQEFLLAIGPAVEELFVERGLRQGAERGVAREVALRLDPPPLPRWSTYTVGGGAVIAGLVGGVFGLLAREKESAFHAMLDQDVVNGAELMEIGGSAESRADLANYSYIGAGAFALTAAVMAFFTDWHGYAAE